MTLYVVSRDNYLVSVATPRFGSGEGKGIIKESVRGSDLYILTDVGNYDIKYSMTFVEKNIYNVNMKYRLIQNGKYLKGVKK